MKHNVPKERKFGKATKTCRRCGTHRAHIDKYGLDLCRKCFREVGPSIGWKKYS
ncbi:MAG: 30S ribosomal protein S14 [Nanoarchaeota archaeon]